MKTPLERNYLFLSALIRIRYAAAAAELKPALASRLRALVLPHPRALIPASSSPSRFCLAAPGPRMTEGDSQVTSARVLSPVGVTLPALPAARSVLLSRRRAAGTLWLRPGALSPGGRPQLASPALATRLQPASPRQAAKLRRAPLAALPHP
jgi:hypothetical protein